MINIKKEKFDIVYVVLVFRTAKELEAFCKSVYEKCLNFKIIVINSFYDEYSKKEIETVAKKYNCDFINVPNKGYSFGNNKGIDFAKKRYDFKYLIISNPDIIIINFNTSLLDINNVYAPAIIDRNNKNQNPFRVSESRILEFIKYIGYKLRIKSFVYFTILIYKLLNNLFAKRTIFACHGSFTILGSNALNKLPRKIYNEKMFLFCEEEHLAKMLEKYCIKIFLTNDIRVQHLQDCSTKYIADKTFSFTRNSFITCYQYWKYHKD